MGVTSTDSTWSHHKIEKHSNIKMAFYIYEQPAFTMEHFHPGFCRSLRSMITLPMNRQWSLMENLFEEDSLACQSNQSCYTSKSEKNEENIVIEPKTQMVSTPFMSKV